MLIINKPTTLLQILCWVIIYSKEYLKNAEKMQIEL